MPLQLAVAMLCRCMGIDMTPPLLLAPHTVLGLHRCR